MEEKKPIIELKNIVKTYDDKIILKNINLSINQGEFITLLGPSGSGKTTILRLIAGFEWATRGEILFKGLDIKDLPPHMRDVSTIFQDYALFPHLSVENNIKYGLRLKRIPLPKSSIKPNIFAKQKSLQKKWAKQALEATKKLDKIILKSLTENSFVDNKLTNSSERVFNSSSLFSGDSHQVKE